jgi:hypothetical protein
MNWDESFVCRGDGSSDMRGAIGGLMWISFQRRTLLLAFASVLVAAPVWSQERPYKEGSIWTVSFVKTKNGMADEYLQEVVPARKKLMDEAQKQGLVISYKILWGSSANRDDWDILFLEEYKNWAAFDGLAAKFDALAKKVIGDEAAQTRVMVKRIELRELFGDKVMQELIPK